MNAATVFTIFGKFLYLFAASLVLGLLLGLFSALLLKRFNVSHTPQVLSPPLHHSVISQATVAPGLATPDKK